jgi:hypothetical protein
MAPRTLFAWIFVALLVFTAIFFTYHILDASSSSSNNPDYQQIAYESPNTMPVEAKNEFHDAPMHYESLNEQHDEMIAKPMPKVVGQTEEDLRATRPVSETPSPVEYPEPEAIDPMEHAANSESEFGDNLRHPEQMIEMHPPMGTMRVAPSGLGSEEPPSMGNNQSIQYSPEMAQNGGEFMSGIFAFDGSDGSGGIGYSMV